MNDTRIISVPARWALFQLHAAHTRALIAAADAHEARLARASGIGRRIAPPGALALALALGGALTMLANACAGGVL